MLTLKHTSTIMASNPVSWFEIAVTDMKRAKQFYEMVFDVSLTHLPLRKVGSTGRFPCRKAQWGREERSPPQRE